MSWKLILKTDKNGQATDENGNNLGNLQPLTQKIQAGSPIRFSFIDPHGSEERYCDADYLVIYNSIVYAQSTKILSYYLDPDPRRAGRVLFVPQTYHYFVMVSTKGFYDSIRWLVGAHDPAPKPPKPGELYHEQDRIDINWYVPG